MKTIIFDFDGTLTKKNNEIWRKIWGKLDALDVDDALYNKVKKGELNYEDWCTEIQKEFINRKLNSKMIDELIIDIEMMDNLEEALDLANSLRFSGKDIIIDGDYVHYYIQGSQNLQRI